jgi:hypothetical protein
MLFFLFLTFIYTLTCLKTINIIVGFFLFLMGVGYFMIQLNLSLGILFLLIYLSAISIVLLSVILLLGCNIQGTSFSWLCIPFIFFFCEGGITMETLFFYFPNSLSSFTLSFLISDLLVQGLVNLFLLSIYFFTVGLFLTGSFFKSLYHKSSTGIRALRLAERWTIPLI